MPSGICAAAKEKKKALDSSPISAADSVEFARQIGRDDADRVPQELADDIDAAERGDQNDGRTQRYRRPRCGPAWHRHGPGFLTVANGTACSRAHACAPPRARRATAAPQVAQSCESSIGDRAGQSGRRTMTAIDFAAFVDELATVSGETIRAVFPHHSRRRRQGPAGRFDPVTAADRAAEDAMRTLIQKNFPRTASSARNSAASAPTRNMSGCSTRSTAPSPSSPACRPGAR